MLIQPIQNDIQVQTDELPFEMLPLPPSPDQLEELDRLREQEVEQRLARQGIQQEK